MPPNYKPPSFNTKALQHTNVDCSWDATDVTRLEVTRRKVTKDDLQEYDFKAYIATSSESESEDEPEKLEFVIETPGYS
jgi:hypothetical protein